MSQSQAARARKNEPIKEGSVPQNVIVLHSHSWGLKAKGAHEINEIITFLSRPLPSFMNERDSICLHLLQQND